MANEMKGVRVCSVCGQLWRGKPPGRPGIFWLIFILTIWCFPINLALFLLPSHAHECPDCKGRLIPAESPRGQALAKG